jgi:putative PIN family toxin of toxin-antitoxin system
MRSSVSKPRYVFDNSVVVSALLFDQSVPAQAFFAALDAGEILLSPMTFTELSEVLSRKKFDCYATSDERERFLAMLLSDATLVDIVEEVRLCRDPKDDKFLELAVSGRGSCIVTGDQDLLVLHPFRGVPILTPAQFLTVLSQKSEEGISEETP